jgi:hypothetical protein
MAVAALMEPSGRRWAPGLRNQQSDEWCEAGTAILAIALIGRRYLTREGIMSPVGIVVTVDRLCDAPD